MKKLLFICFLISVISNLYAAPTPEVWEKWNEYNLNSTLVINHELWTTFLKRNLVSKNGMNLVKYSEVNRESYNNLSSYIEYLTSQKITNLNREEQKSVWINLYNALTIKVVLDHYPVKSIKNINISGLFKIGPWDKKLVSIESEEISLNDIEHKILRPIWNDHRIHYSLNCASMSCPELQKEAFTPNNIEGLLNIAEGTYLKSSYGHKFLNNTLILSSIYNWFYIDFGKDEEEVINYIESIINIRDYKKIKYSYDWSLNAY
ncbi:MAG: DUF547 domain-containing protein [Spirochaetaceae bacterium]